jgi:hypothetical protein
MTLALLRILGVGLHPRQQFRLAWAFVERRLLRAIGIMFGVARAAFRAFGRAGCFVIHGVWSFMTVRLSNGANLASSQGRFV